MKTGSLIVLVESITEVLSRDSVVVKAALNIRSTGPAFLPCQ